MIGNYHLPVTIYQSPKATSYHFPIWRWFARFGYDTLEYIKNVRCPVMLIYSRNDEVVPFEFGLELYEAAGEPKEFVEIFGSHNDGFLVSAEIYRKAWSNWLKFLKVRLGTPYGGYKSPAPILTNDNRIKTEGLLSKLVRGQQFAS